MTTSKFNGLGFFPRYNRTDESYSVCNADGVFINGISEFRAAEALATLCNLDLIYQFDSGALEVFRSIEDACALPGDDAPAEDVPIVEEDQPTMPEDETHLLAETQKENSNAQV